MSETLFNIIGLGETSDNSTGAYDNILGMTKVFASPNGGGIKNTYRLVENASGIALTPKRTVIYKSGQIEKQVDGYCYVEADPVAGVVDDQLPSAGAADGHVFWICVEGDILASTSLAADSGNLLPANTVLVGATAATSQATTAGRVKAADFTGATAVLAGQINNSFGRAISAKTTANTGVAILSRVRFK